MDQDSECWNELFQFIKGKSLLILGDFKKGGIMLNWAVTFFVIAIIAAVLGFTRIAGSAIDIAKILFFVFLLLAVVSFIFGRKVTT